MDLDLAAAQQAAELVKEPAGRCALLSEIARAQGATCAPADTRRYHDEDERLRAAVVHDVKQTLDALAHLLPSDSSLAEIAARVRAFDRRHGQQVEDAIREGTFRNLVSEIHALDDAERKHRVIDLLDALDHLRIRDVALLSYLVDAGEEFDDGYPILVRAHLHRDDLANARSVASRARGASTRCWCFLEIYEYRHGIAAQESSPRPPRSTLS